MTTGLEPSLRTSPRSPTDDTLEFDARDVRHPDGLEELDRRLAALCREQGPLRAVLARMATRLVELRAWERLGYARLSDYAAERLGLSARSVQSLASVGAKLPLWPRLERALVSGRLGWTHVRLLASLPADEDETTWIARAQRMTAARLSRQVRGVDRGSVEAGAVENAEARSRVFEVCCSPEVRWKWVGARGAASRTAGRMLQVAEAAELIAAEVLSSLPIDEGADGEEVRDEAGAAWDDGDDAPAEERPWVERRGRVSAASAPAGTQDAAESRLYRLLDGLERADAFGVDERLRRALAREQRLEARVSPLLVRVWGRGVHWALGYSTREAYARERLGMDPTRARALVRVERAAVESRPFARAWRTGRLSWVKAEVLVPLVSADPLGRFVEDWTTWAGQVTVRRLREDADRALAIAETDPEAFRRGGGLPPEARVAGGGPGTGNGLGADVPDREIRAPRRESRGDITEPVGYRGAAEGGRVAREIGATHREPKEGHSEPASDREDAAREHLGQEAPARESDETCSVRFIGSAAVVRLFRAVLCSVRRRIEADTGRLPTAGEALGVMVDHALESWRSQGGKVAPRHRVLARDGWRCAAPGCSSMQNLHDHHIRFRSAGGSDVPENRVTLCAFHHLRGVHAGRLRCTGRAPGALTWHLGIRPGAAPLLSYRSGDRRLTGARRPTATST